MRKKISRKSSHSKKEQSFGENELGERILGRGGHCRVTATRTAEEETRYQRISLIANLTAGEKKKKFGGEEKNI